MSEQEVSWYNGPLSRLVLQVSAGMENAARGLSGMLGRTITTGTSQAKVVRFSELYTDIGHPETGMVGIYLLMEGDLSGQAILILTVESALDMVDLLMEDPPGTSTSLGDLERSALGEVGNLTVAYFLNAMSSLTGRDLRPSTPAVMADMLGAILNVLATTAGMTGDELLIIETVIQDPKDRLVEARFWVIPDLSSEIE
jgi:chemotaxis protein CheC